MAKAKSRGFRWLPSYYEAVRDLPDNDRLIIYDAILDFGFGNQTPELTGTLNSLFCLIKPTLEQSIRFEQKQYDNGCKGGRPRKNPDVTQKNPNEFGGNLDIDVDIDVDIDNAIERQTPERDLSRRGSPDEFGPIIHEQDTGTVPAYITGRNLDG